MEREGDRERETWRERGRERDMEREGDRERETWRERRRERDMHGERDQRETWREGDRERVCTDRWRHEDETAEMNATVCIALIFAPLFAVVTFYALRQTFITIQIDVFVRAPAADVFDYVKEPRNLPLVNHVMLVLWAILWASSCFSSSFTPNSPFFWANAGVLLLTHASVAG